jgi:hypothetical protein
MLFFGLYHLVFQLVLRQNLAHALATALSQAQEKNEEWFQPQLVPETFCGMVCDVLVKTNFFCSNWSRQSG